MERAERYSGHESFVCRYGWLRKLYDAVEKDPLIFRSDEAAIAELGIGRNMVKAMLFWGDAFGITQGTASDGVKPTAFGHQLLGPKGFDPYLEDMASLWLLHWVLSTQANLGAWNTLFRDVRDVQFTRTRFTELVMRRARAAKNSIHAKTVEDHARILFQTYIPGKFGPDEVLEDSLGSPFQELGLLREVDRHQDESIVAFDYGPKLGLTVEVFAHALSDYWVGTAPTGATLSLRDIAYGTGSPGTIFRLDEDSVVSYLKTLGKVTRLAFTFVDTPDVRMVNRRNANAAFNSLAGART